MASNRGKRCVAGLAPGATGNNEKLDILTSPSRLSDVNVSSSWPRHENFSPRRQSTPGEGTGASHQILRAVQLMRGRSAARDQGFKHGTDDDAFHVLGCGFVVHCGEVISKTSLVCNAKAPVKGSFHHATQLAEAKCLASRN